MMRSSIILLMCFIAGCSLNYKLDDFAERAEKNVLSGQRLIDLDRFDFDEFIVKGSFGTIGDGYYIFMENSNELSIYHYQTELIGVPLPSDVPLFICLLDAEAAEVKQTLQMARLCGGDVLMIYKDSNRAYFWLDESDSKGYYTFR